jgi:cytochrome aa3-600 menaquinol oxidase subunit 4
MSTRVEAHPEPEPVQAYEAGFEWLNPHFAAVERFPWAQVAGYAGSLVLTLAALYLVVHHLLAPGVLAAVVLVLAAGQAGLQLGVFMHLREARGTAWQVLPLFLAFAIALGLVGMSVWVMAFKSGVS